MAQSEQTDPKIEADAAPANARRGARIACAVVVAAYLATALTVQFIVRLDWGPDEPDHVLYVHTLSRGELPTGAETHQVQHGPVYYAMQAVLWRAVGVQQDPSEVPRGISGLAQMTDRAKLGRRVLRGTNALLGVAFLLVLLRILTVLETPWAWRPWLLLLAAGNPVLHYLGAVVNNEMASILYSAIICLFIVRRLRAEDCSVWDAAVLGLLIGGTLLVKRTGLFVLPLALWLLWTHGPRSERLTRLGAFFGCAVAIGIWWPLYARPGMTGYLGTATAPDSQPTLSKILHSPSFLSWITTLLETALLPDWYLEIVLRGPMQIIGSLVLASILAVAIWGLVARHDRFHYRLRTLSVVAMLTLMLAVVHYVVTVDWRAHMHGRYLLNAAPWLVCLFAGMWPVVDRLDRRLADSGLWQRLRETVAVLIALAICVFDAAWWYLAWEFYSNIERRFGL